ncbi:hypothetical protein JCM8097_005550 [Rhodosporidiobolus ruineniae]
MASEPLPASLQAYKPTPLEKQAYDYLFNKADTNELGVLTGDLAVPFFSHSQLPPLILGEVWQLADPDNSGFLSPDRFGLACRLIAHAQEKRKTGAPEVRPEWIGQPGPLPTFTNYPLPAHLLAAAPPTSPKPPTRGSSIPPPAAAPLSPAPTGQAAPAQAKVDINHISPEDKAKYARVFAGANGGSLAGLLDGDKARDIFIKSNLPYDVLGQIWNLSDTHSRGALDLTDFTIGLHLLHLIMDGTLPASAGALPSVLDPKLYAAAAGLSAPGTSTGSGAGQPPSRQSSLAVGVPPSPAPAPPAAANQDWAISAQEKAESDAYFDSLDPQKRGRIEGEQAVGFFGQSGLEVGVLARVWDLSDLRNDGYLTKDTFAVAMHLLKSKVANPAQPLPDQLPAELIPPSLRSTAPAQQQPPQPQRDLLDLLDDDAPAVSVVSSPAPPLQPQPTGSSFHAASTPRGPLSPQPTGPVVPAGTARAISPALSPQATGGSFQGLQGTIFPQATGGSASASGFGNDFAPSSPVGASTPPVPPVPRQFAQPPQQGSQLKTSTTFFDDNDDADLASSAAALESQAAQLRNEEGQLAHQGESAGQTRAELEKSVEALNAEIAALQGRISTAREAHEAEVQRVEDLRARERQGKDRLAAARHQLIAAESDLSGLRQEKAELEGEVLRDKEELRETERRVKHVEEEKRVLAAEVERVRKEVRQGKGRGAVARKQLSTAEQGREKLAAELEAAKAGKLAGEEVEEDDVVPPVQHQAAQVPLPISTVVSPTASVRSTNPFDRLTQAAALSPQSTGQSTNPFAFASSSPAPSPAPPVQEPEQYQAPRGETPSTSLPVAAAAAVGTGALAALGAGATAVAGALGIEQHHQEEVAKEEKEDEADPFGVPSSTSAPPSGGFDDAFAAPASTSTSTGFDDAFAVAAQAPAEDAQGGAAFDDAFADFPASSSPTSAAHAAPEDKPIEGTLGDVDAQAGFDDAFRDLSAAEAEAHGEEGGRVGKDAVEGTLGEVEPQAGFEEAFREVSEHHELEGKERAAESAREDVDDSSSDEDDEGPEDVFASASASRARLDRSPTPEPESVVAPSAEQEQEPESKSREPTTSTTQSSSESGESYVHVDAPAGISSSFVSAASTAEPVPASVPVDTEAPFDPIVGPAGTEESREMLEDPAPASFEPPSPEPEPVEQLEEVEPVASSPTTTSKRRAAPPPPTRSAAAEQGGFASAVPAPAPVEDEAEHVEQPSAVPSAAALPLEEVNEQKAEEKPLPVPVASPPAPETNPEDDFDSAFADMGASTSSAADFPVATATTATGFGDEGDDAFEFKDDFADSAAVPAASATSGGAEFDDAAFADFDQSFPAVSAPSASSAAAPAESAFDDAFASFPSSGAGNGEPALGAPVAAVSPAPPASTSPLPPTPQDEPAPFRGAEAGDSDAVAQIVGMGFSREKAVEALEKYNYDVERAVNGLLTGA